jgi:hypothetical protein
MEISSNFMKICQLKFSKKNNFWYQNLRKYAICENVIILILAETYFKKCQYAHNMTYKYQFMQPEKFGLNRNYCRDNRVLVPNIDNFGLLEPLITEKGLVVL